MTDDEATVTIPRWWIVGICLAGAAIGVGAAFMVGPVVDWLLSLAGDAPGPLRIAARLPLVWAIPILAFLGVIVGLMITHEWRTDVGTVTVSARGVTIEGSTASQFVAGERVGGVFTDGKDLVITDPKTNEISRSKTDVVLVSRLRRAFERFDYPWQGNDDPHEKSYISWVDGAVGVDDRINDLLRARSRALADERSGAAAEALDELRSLGIAVRDRDGAQQYRMIPD
ncbi:hypothetical protein ACFORJ_07465 [Corynebacterium hansenii]|uniref:DUF308 domain-containing protein n=1 Tax=Corynebacterium hansenii TaxID=394964 RepID=A0ABV7ZN56_9CORY|nr:hypothetical protein [Corynebacterium hansenii]WJZ00587.1 hypothetical protein CHAN_09920 [Corynebacterium hansenii]